MRTFRGTATLSVATLATAGAIRVGAIAPGTGNAKTPVARVAKPSGTVNVLYAGSLEDVMNSTVGPAFHRATGYTFSGYPAGSTDLASEIKGKVQQGDVFISASPKVNVTLEGKKNGNWVSWFAPFATTKLVLGYNPNSAFASALKSKPWYQVITQPGFRLGFTDPTLDPKGVLAVAALNAAARKYSEPALKRSRPIRAISSRRQDLVGRLQAGQLDAGFFYTVEASAAKIPIVSLGSIKETATYTITVLNRCNQRCGRRVVRQVPALEPGRASAQEGRPRDRQARRGR